MKPPALIALTAAGATLALRLRGLFPGAAVYGLAGRGDAAGVEGFTDFGAELRRLFLAGRPIVGVCAAGVLIRALAPLLDDKRREPPLVALADDGSAVVPLLGGHRGANWIAERIAEHLGTRAAITTAGERRFGLALDRPPPGWQLAEPAAYKPFVATLLAEGAEVVLDDSACEAAWLRRSELVCHEPGAEPEKTAALPRIVVSPGRDSPGRDSPGRGPRRPRTLWYHPQQLALGVGCERGVAVEELSALVEATLAEHNLAAAALALVASHEVKSDEAAVLQLASALDRPCRFFTSAELERETPRLATPSAVVFRELGCHGVAEAAALAAAGPRGELVIAKTKSRRATCALARAPAPIDPAAVGRGRGVLSVVGIGPGGAGWRTPQAERAILAADDVVGYRLYLQLIETLLDPGSQQRHLFELGEETLRVRTALELAACGRRVALVCSGDAGIYAMAALVFEQLDHAAPPAWRRIEVEVIPGISALQAAAARSGALLGHDFCAISLSDLLTPWQTIEKRVRAAAEGDFVIAFYNPVSRRRTTQLRRALEILLQHRPAATPAVLARDLGRAGEWVRVCRLDRLDPAEVDMLTVVLVGAAASRRLGDRVYTPRGYAGKNRGPVAS